jgi:hypothetical protein
MLKQPPCIPELTGNADNELRIKIKKILKHLGLWERKARPPPKATLPEKTYECSIDYSSSQVLPDSDKWLYAGPEYPDNFTV